MIDPKLAGAPIVRRTACHSGTHAFTWAGYGFRENPELPPFGTRCDCDSYTWDEWQKVQEETS